MATFEDGLPFFPFGSRLLRFTTPRMAGTDVKVLQDVFDNMLTIMNPPQGPIGPPVPVTGIFDEATDAAVRNIQSYFGLLVDGIAGPQTYLAFGQATGAFVSYGGPVFGSRNLAQGASGGDVTVLENRLNCFRYSQEIGGPADGIYAVGTSGAVVEFQMDANLNGGAGVPITGDVGFETFDALWIYTYAGGRNLAVGTKGFDVVWVQHFLQQKVSSLNRPYYQGPIHGFFGSELQASVRLWQADNNLPRTGVVNPLTYFSFGFNNPNRAPFPAPLPPEPRPLALPCAIVLARVGPMPPLTLDSQGTALIRMLASGGQSVTVTAVGMPPPSAFGNFDAYEAFVSIPEIGGFGFLLFPTPEDPPTWSGTLTIGEFLSTGATVVVRPTNTQTGQSGRGLLSGALSACTADP